MNVASGTFTDLDFTNLRMLRNGGDTAFKLDGNITRGSIHGCKLRSQNDAAAITGSGLSAISTSPKTSTPIPTATPSISPAH